MMNNRKTFVTAIIIAMYALGTTICHSQGMAMEKDLPEVMITEQIVKDNPTLAERLGQIKGITSVYVSKSMMKMAGSGVGSMTKGMTDKLDNIHIFNAETPSKGKELRSLAEKHMKDNHYEKVVEVNEEDTYMCIRMKEMDKDLREFVLLTVEEKGVSVIIMTGNITENDLTGMKL